MHSRPLAGWKGLVMATAAAGLVLAPWTSALAADPETKSGGATGLERAKPQLNSEIQRPLLFPRTNYVWPFASGPVYGDVDASRWNEAGVLHTRVGSFDLKRGAPAVPENLRGAVKRRRARPVLHRAGRSGVLRGRAFRPREVAHRGRGWGTPGSDGGGRLHHAPEPRGSRHAQVPAGCARRRAVPPGLQALADHRSRPPGGSRTRGLRGVRARSGAPPRRGRPSRGAVAGRARCQRHVRPPGRRVLRDPSRASSPRWRPSSRSRRSSRASPTCARRRDDRLDHADRPLRRRRDPLSRRGRSAGTAAGSPARPPQILMVLDSGIQLDAGDLSDTRTSAGTAGAAHRKVRLYTTAASVARATAWAATPPPRAASPTATRWPRPRWATRPPCPAATARGWLSRHQRQPVEAGRRGARRAARSPTTPSVTPRTLSCGDPTAGHGLVRATSTPTTPRVGLAGRRPTPVAPACSTSRGAPPTITPTAPTRIDDRPVPVRQPGRHGVHRGRKRRQRRQRRRHPRRRAPSRIPATRKSCIVVGASGNVDEPNTAPTSDRGAFSSVGPTVACGRIDPVLMAPGTDFGRRQQHGDRLRVQLPHATTTTRPTPCECDIVQGLEGTSFAARPRPGAALLVRDYFPQGFYPDGTSSNPGQRWRPGGQHLGRAGQGRCSSPPPTSWTATNLTPCQTSASTTSRATAASSSATPCP